MKIKVVKNLKLPLSYTYETLVGAVSHAITLSAGKISCKILKKSLDARKKDDIHFVVTASVEFLGKAKYDKRRVEEIESIEYIPTKLNKRVPARLVVVGAGPCGLFCALTLAEGGVAPVVLERGDRIEDRTRAVNAFFVGGELLEDSNVQFGEGGAGAFSDGKLNTGTKSPVQEYVFRKFVESGAPECILYDAHPHIGTDKLKPTVKGLRERIISLGGRFEFGAKMVDFVMENGAIKGVKYVQNGTEIVYECDYVVLATGHSARDVFGLLKGKTEMEQKPFSVGVRIEHLQKDINLAQFGKDIGIASEYKLSERMSDGRGVYTFCMCPGGVVVPATSEKGGVVTNGMSNFDRAEKNANSAVLVSVTPNDFGSPDVLAGVEFQRKLERKAYLLGGGNYSAPYQTVGDFYAKRASNGYGIVEPSYARGVKGVDMRSIFPDFVIKGIETGLKAFDSKLKGFCGEESVMTGVETRSSSPVRIKRGEDLTAIDIKNLYPAGEGAGYAGGITSSAVDGVKVAEEIIKKING